MILKLGMQHRELEVAKVFINDDPGLTLTYFTARSNLAAYVFDWGHSKANDKTDRKYMFLRNKMDPRGLSAPAPGLYTCTWTLISNIIFFS